MPPSKKSKSARDSCCPLTIQPRLRLATDAQTDSIKGNFPKGVARPALRALYAAGLTSLDQLTELTERELSELHGMGPKALMLLRQALIEVGSDFRSDNS